MAESRADVAKGRGPRANIRTGRGTDRGCVGDGITRYDLNLILQPSQRGRPSSCCPPRCDDIPPSPPRPARLAESGRGWCVGQRQAADNALPERQALAAARTPNPRRRSRARTRHQACCRLAIACSCRDPRERNPEHLDAKKLACLLLAPMLPLWNRRH